MALMTIEKELFNNFEVQRAFNNYFDKIIYKGIKKTIFLELDVFLQFEVFGEDFPETNKEINVYLYKFDKVAPFVLKVIIDE